MKMFILSEKELIDILQSGEETFISIGYLTKSFPELNSATHLEELFIPINDLTSLPALDKLIHLKTFSVWRNKITTLPENIKTISHKYTAERNFPKWLNYSDLVL